MSDEPTKPVGQEPLGENIPEMGIDYQPEIPAENNVPGPTEASQALREARQNRFNLGALFLVPGTLIPIAFIGVVTKSYPSLPTWEAVQEGLNGPIDGRFYYLLALLGGKSAFVLANIWLLYQLLRAAERLFIPPEIAKDAPLLLGVKLPQKEGPKIASQQAVELLDKAKEIVVAALPGESKR